MSQNGFGEDDCLVGQNVTNIETEILGLPCWFLGLRQNLYDHPP
jgi:hypothetical protein